MTLFLLGTFDKSAMTWIYCNLAGYSWKPVLSLLTWCLATEIKGEEGVMTRSLQMYTMCESGVS